MPEDSQRSRAFPGSQPRRPGGQAGTARPRHVRGSTDPVGGGEAAGRTALAPTGFAAEKQVAGRQRRAFAAARIPAFGIHSGRSRPKIAAEGPMRLGSRKTTGSPEGRKLPRSGLGGSLPACRLCADGLPVSSRRDETAFPQAREMCSGRSPSNSPGNEDNGQRDGGGRRRRRARSPPARESAEGARYREERASWIAAIEILAARMTTIKLRLGVKIPRLVRFAK